MSTEIKFTAEYMEVLDNMLKVVADLPNKRHALLFKKDDTYMHSAMALDTLVHTSTSSKNIKFDIDELAITNLTEFINYANAIEYPENEAKISFIEELTTKKEKINSFKFEGVHSTYRMPVAQSSAFRKDYDKKVPVSRNADPMDLVGKFFLDTDDIRRFVNDIQLMGKSNAFGLAIVNDKITMYMTNIQNHQVTKVIDETKAKVFNSYTTTPQEQDNTQSFKLFPNKIFRYMSYFGCDFEVELRVLKKAKGDIMAIKCFGIMDFADNKKPKSMKKDGNTPEPVNVFIGTQENSAHAASANMLKIVKD